MTNETVAAGPFAQVEVFLTSDAQTLLFEFSGGNTPDQRVLLARGELSGLISELMRINESLVEGIIVSEGGPEGP